LINRCPVGDMVGHTSLPEDLIGNVMDVLQLLSASERDLIRVVVEVINELRDPTDADDNAAVRGILSSIIHPSSFNDS
jgi:condensin complex subunit 3